MDGTLGSRSIQFAAYASLDRLQRNIRIFCRGGALRCLEVAATKKMDGPLPDRPFRRPRRDRAQVIVFETFVSTLLILPPTEPIAVIAATAISEAMRVYSMAVAPRSFFIRLRKMDSMCISKDRKSTRLN